VAALTHDIVWMKKQVVNSELLEAGNRLDALAGHNLINQAGGIIAGRDIDNRGVYLEWKGGGRCLALGVASSWPQLDDIQVFRNLPITN